MREETRSGLACLEAATELLRRIRGAHPTNGLFEAAELHFWWSAPRSTDTFEQIFWFDDDDRPAAALLCFDFGQGTSLVYSAPTLVVAVMPDATREWVAHVVDRGLTHLADHGIESVELEIDNADTTMRDLLVGRGFVNKGEVLIECWLDADAHGGPVEISPLPPDYRLTSRTELQDRTHHMASAVSPDRQQRLLEASLYRTDLDLVVLDADDEPAAWGIFWHDPVTSTGVVEPVRTHDDHQQRGLARHILTAGVNRLIEAGARRISIGYEPDNPASGHLYRSVGFVPHRHTDLYAGPTG